MSVTQQVPIKEYTANGLTTVFTFDFYVIKASDLVVYLDGVKAASTTYTLSGVGNSNGGEVTFLVAPSSGKRVTIKRETPLSRNTQYVDNGDLLASTINEDFDRLWLQLQEQRANFSSSLSRPVVGNWDAQTLKINNLADGAAQQDAVTYKQLMTVNGSAGQSASAAATSASQATQSAALASSAAAQTGQDRASTTASETLARGWASNPEDVVVTGGLFSSLHYSRKAAASATAAAGSATSAASSQQVAGNSATAAQASQQAAATSAAAAAQSASNIDVTRALLRTGIILGEVVWFNGPRMINGVSNLPVGFVPADGDTFNRADYPELWAKIQSGSLFSQTEALWANSGDTAAPWKWRSRFSTGNGSTTFRVPDLNGKQSVSGATSLQHMFLSGSRDALSGTGGAPEPGLISAQSAPNVTSVMDIRRSITTSSTALDTVLGTGGAMSASIVSANSHNPVQLSTASFTQAQRLSTDLSLSDSTYGRNGGWLYPHNATGTWIVRVKYPF